MATSGKSRPAAVTLGWFAIFAWGPSPDRPAIPDYAAETPRYIEQVAEPGMGVNGSP